MKRLLSLLIVFSMLLVAMNTNAAPINVIPEDIVAENYIEVENSRSGEIKHPFKREFFRFMLIGGDRAFLNLSNEQKEAEVATLRAMSIENLAEYIKGQMKALPNSGTRPAYERLTAIMSVLAMDNQDDYLMKQVITILYTSACEYENVPVRDSSDIYKSSYNEAPSFCVFAYDIAFENSYWDELSEKYGVDTRATVENWFREIFDRIYNVNIDRVIGNYGGYWIKHLAGIAVVLNDPDRVRCAIELIDKSLRSSQFYGDGMWREGSFSYGQMLIGNCAEATYVINLYKDPEDYVDTKFGIKLDYTNIRSRWPIMDEWLDEINGKYVYPNGAPVAINDNHYSATVKFGDPIKAEYLKNTELNHFGLYNIKYGNTDEAQQINLKYAPISEGLPYSSGHSHGDFLGLTMWSGGMEILPDGGYVFSPDANRYLHMNAIVHNCSWIYSSKAEPYNTRGSRYVKNNTLAYDDGSKNQKQIQLIEAECNHTDFDYVDMKRRAVFMIATDENHSYTVDIQRLKGGTVHENYLRQVEEEDVELFSSLKLPDAEENTLGGALKALGKSGGIVMSETMLTSPQIVHTEEAFDFTWKGKETGTSMHAFIKGNPDATVAFSMFPTMRRVNNVIADKDKYPGYHFYQRQDVSPRDVTIYGGVYEGFRKDEEGKVKDVQWIPAPDGNPLTQLVKIELSDAVDYVYISDDNKIRQFGNLSFGGNYAAVRFDKNEENVIWRYLYGEGVINTRKEVFKGKSNHLYQVLSVSGKFEDRSIPNRIRIRGVLPKEVKGLWGHTIYGDGSGVAFKIKDVDQSVLSLNNTPGFKLDAKGVYMNNFPAYVTPQTGLIPDTSNLSDSTFRYQEERRRIVPGTVWFELKIPSFENIKN